MPAAERQTSPSDEQPLRLLLVRIRPGEVPWFAEAVARLMGPVDLVQVVGMASALWRLGQERFDTVLLDPEVSDPLAIRHCRDQIADVAAVPVLGLHDEAAPARGRAAAGRNADDRRRAPRKVAVNADDHSAARLPWERRAKHQPAA